MFARISVSMLEPDLVIMDEFQRFKFLLSSDDSELGILAHSFLSGHDTRVLLLSATPYKLYSTLEEIDENQLDEHYAEFFQVMNFLFDDEVKDIKFKEVWKNYSHALSELKAGDSAIIRMKELAENAMYQGVSRTERISVMDSGDYTDDSSVKHHLQIDENDINSYIQMSRLLSKTDSNHSLPVDYAKSCPYLMSFMKKYKIKEQIEKYYIKHPDEFGMLGGIKRIGQVTEKLVPFMALFYIILAVGVVIINWKNVPGVFSAIIRGAFNPASVTGGVVGSFFMSMKKGVSRGIFSNEAGLGTGSIAHACADTRKPVKQGFFGIFEVFTDTIVICTLTALVILCSGVPVGYGAAAGAELTISGFTSTYGNWVSIFTAVAMCCFAFSTIIGWGLYGARCAEFLFKEKAIRPFMVLYSLVAIIGATVDLGLLWSIAETFNGLMAIPNLIAVFLLSGVVVKLVKEYFAGEGKNA